MPIAYVDIRFSAHATEDLKKVVEAVEHVLPAEYVDNIDFKKNDLRGYYGNPIILFETRIKKKEIIQAFVENLSSNFSELDKEVLLREINLHVEDGSLYLRLDKQAALQGELKLSAADPIRVRIRFRKRKMEDIVKICRELGLIPVLDGSLMDPLIFFNIPRNFLCTAGRGKIFFTKALRKRTNAYFCALG